MSAIPAGYKQTEVGVIPSEWSVASIGTLTTEFRGGAPLKPTDFTDRGMKVLPKGGVGRSGILRIADKDLQFCSSQYAESHPRNQVDNAFTIVVLRDLVPSGPSIGLMVAIDTNERFVLAQGVYGFKVNPVLADALYLIQLSNTDWYRKLANNIMVGSTQVHITNTAFKKALLPVPPTPEQRAIAAALSDVDALLAKLDQFIAKKRDLKQAAMQQLLTGQTRLPGFSGEWEVKRLGDSCELVTKGTTPTSIGKSFTKSGINFLKAESISESGKTISDKVAFIDEATHRLLKRSQLMINDVLISIAGVLGRVGLVDESDLPANTNQALAIVRLGKESAVIRIFLFYCLSSPLIERQIGDFNVQAAQANISLENVRDLMIHLPPTKAEQTAIATVLSDMDAELAALEARRDKTRALKQGMMQELLTGRIRLV